MRRICIFCETWESGGIEAFLCNVLRHMDLSGLEVDLVAARLGKSLFTQPLKDRGVRFYELSGKANETFRNHKTFRALLAQRHYDVLHLNVFQGLSLAYARLAREAGVPVRIAHSHNTDLRQSLTRWLKLELHQWARGRYGADCTHLWACSEGAARFMFAEKDLQEKDWQFIPNGIETEKFRFDPAARLEVREKLGLSDEFVIGNVGRLCRQKNQSFLLEVLQEVVRQRPNSRLLLVGEGEELPQLQEKAAALGVADKAIFYGTTPHVERLYQAMDVFAMPSKFEGLPVTAIEAQAAGLPCLFSNIITRECHVGTAVQFLPLSTPVIWAKAISQVQLHNDRSEGAAIVQVADFDVTVVSQKLQETYLREGGYEQP